MGYRKLLKDYLSHVSAVLGTDLVELAGLTRAFSRRELGELRTIAAELKREGYGDSESQNYDHVIRALLESGDITLEDIARAQGFNDAQTEKPATADEMRNMLLQSARQR